MFFNRGLRGCGKTFDRAEGDIDDGPWGIRGIWGCGLRGEELV